MMATAVAALPAAQPLDRSLSKMMMRAEAGGDDETDMYAQYKLKQREHEFLKTTIRMAPVRWHASARGWSPCIRCRSVQTCFLALIVSCSSTTISTPACTSAHCPSGRHRHHRCSVTIGR